MPSPHLKILFVTGSALKLADVKKYLGPYEIVVESALLNLPELQAATVEEIAREKCRRAAEIVSMLKRGISFIYKMR
jgi:inosine/xanthosine triphosphate pyrophosphatase family protein